MSIGFPSSSPRLTAGEAPRAVTLETKQHIRDVLETVQASVAPVWPLKDYVAVNPYGGFSDQTFLEASKYLQQVSDCEMLMPLSYYRVRFQRGMFGLAELETAIDEMVEDQIPGAESLCANAIFQILSAEHTVHSASDDFGSAVRKPCHLSSISQCLDRFTGKHWTETIHEEISKHCAAHYDEGQASWGSPWKHLPLYQAWRSAAQHDRKIEILGLRKFRRFVGNLPHTPEAATACLLKDAGVPERLWKDYLLCLALDLPGWSAWAKFKTVEAQKQGREEHDFAGLLAMRLAYDVALSHCFDFHVNFQTATCDQPSVNDSCSRKSLVCFALLRANEIGFRKRVLNGMAQQATVVSNSASPHPAPRKLAQMVFCIDVRSERMRRNLESTSDEIETFGFAGFFGLPFEYVRLGENCATNQLPVLVEPKFKVFEEIRADQLVGTVQAQARRRRIRTLRKAWKRFQTSAVSGYAFVETMGLLFGVGLLRKTLGIKPRDGKHDGVCPQDRDRLGPSFRDLHAQGVSTTLQADMAESILTSIGLVDNFARLVVLCGHASQTENNPLQAGLDCGACGGHSGEPNARFAAMLLNQPYVRQTLAKRGIEVPDEVHFLAGLHNTTTDAIEFFDLDLMPESHRGLLEELVQHAVVAGQLTRSERLQQLPGKNEASLLRRSTDWSEVRPEWGLTGNAAFVIGPRQLTKSLNLEGESFLHSYDFRRDTDGRVLEQIMTAPLIVANWINMQYYASTVDQKHFGSGCKTIHNVVGKFGILSGNGGDLKTGLPWQSIHDGQKYQHDPVRLLAVIEAPRTSIDRVLANHQQLRNLVVNGWVQLVAVDGRNFYRYSSNQRWEPMEIDSQRGHATLAAV